MATTTRRFLAALSALLLCSLGAACDGSPTRTVEEPPPPAVGAGRLALTVTGLPAGAPASIVLGGPNNLSRTLTGSQTVTGLAPGVYTATVGDVSAEGRVYGTDRTVRFVEVVAGASAELRIEYRAFNLSVENFYITQAVQRYDRSIPLVAGRDGVLRVFARANNVNSVAAQVRVRLYHGGELRSTLVIPAPSFAAPTEIAEAAIGASWNVRVPGALIQPGLRVLVDIDPGASVAEAERADNVYPAGGAPAGLDVRSVPEFQLALVPVRMGDGTVGNVTEANKDEYLSALLRMFPIAAWKVRIRTPYLTSSTLRGQTANDDGGTSWVTMVQDIEALRVTDGRSGEYYYGVARLSYTSGVYGIAYRPGKAAVGNDFLDGRNLNAPMTLAHEIGHSMGRPHSQCGSAGLPDVDYPHPNGQIGAFGLDVVTLRLYSPDVKDLMGYCEDRWIGDYTYEKLLEHRVSVEPGLRNDLPEQPTLVVWGRVDASGPVLEPPFRVNAPPQLPSQAGPSTLEGFDAAGATLFSLSFHPRELSGVGDAGVFAFALPLEMAKPARLTTLRLSTGGRQAVMRAQGAGAGETDRDPPRLRTSRIAGNRLRLDWDAERYPLLLLRDPRTGDIVSFVRGGAATVPGGGGPLEALASDGVRSVSAGVVQP